MNKTNYKNIKNSSCINCLPFFKGSIHFAFFCFFVFVNIFPGIFPLSALAEEANLFLQAIQNNLKVIPSKSNDPIKYRLLREYGSMWANQSRNIVLPPQIAFFSEAETIAFHAKLKLEKLVGTNCLLQSSAANALVQAQKVATQKGLKISPRGSDSCIRSYDTTYKLWLSRVEPNLDFYVKGGKLSSKEANLIRQAPIDKQIALILNLEKERKLFFDKYRATSILNSVAAPGSSQHISGLAFDLAEYENPKVRAIMNEFGWFQTVRNDLPHFTYLGNVQEKHLPALGLKKFTSGQFTFWVPNIPE
ncbi:MAG: D-alanyl-D-alanine carboxypeptidase family protein [Candidatus Melainabacteria bacterium]|jgi:LAS superfamily LD-carboxypeptidase LdcB